MQRIPEGKSVTVPSFASSHALMAAESLLLIVLGIFLFIGEVITPTFGILSLGGTIAFFIGSFFLIDTSSGFPGISLHLIIGFSLFNILLLLILSRILLRSLRRPKQIGQESMIGLTGKVVSVNDYGLQVLVRGELWQAKSNETLVIDDSIHVVSVEGLKLLVEKHKS